MGFKKMREESKRVEGDEDERRGGVKWGKSNI